MSVASSKEVILKKIREALIESTPLPFPQSEGTGPVFLPLQKDLEIQFAEEFCKQQGKFAFCLNTMELRTQLKELVTEKGWTNLFCNEPQLKPLLAGGLENFHTASLADCDAAITTCEGLVARTGSIVLTAAGQSGRTVSVYAPVHICIAFVHQLVYDVKDALQLLKEKYQQHLPSLISFATGPSRTADIEKTLVTGVHGPKEVYVFLVEEFS